MPWKRKGLVHTPFNWELFFNADSRFPERAGLAGAITGTFYMLIVCFAAELSRSASPPPSISRNSRRRTG